MSATLSASPEVKITETECFIGGEWVPAVSGKTFATINPATEQEITQIAEGDQADVDAAANAARQAFESGPWSTMDARDRGKLMFALAQRMEDEIDDLARLETLDNGKPLSDSRNVDLPLAIDCLRYYAGYADKIHGSTIPIRGNHLCYTRREPVGVAGQIIPWNFPILMVAWKWGPALASGCTVVMKPAEQTPLTCLRLAQLAKEVGIPDGVINIVPGYGPTAGSALVKHPLVDKIAFTGEHRTAQIITRESADTLKRLTFELGGKSPNVIFADADMDAAVEGAYVGLFLNQGQCCCAGSRVFVEASRHDEFVEKLQQRTAQRKVGNPFADDTDQGPQVDQAQFDKILSYIEKGKQEGAECVAGGERVGDKGFFVAPTIFDNVRDDMAIATDEIFGPVLSVLTFDDKEDMIRRANNTFYGLAAAVWTRDVSVAHDFAARVRAGTIWVNCYDVFDAAAPFGGFKMSGYGRELGEEGLKAYTENKTVTIAL
ncbi:MAG: aldehyde dehydrogenase family protein [Planctomycetota bacterium]|nr:aldehyde dehydrogenase family protein [Planctomycetota bacterium]